MKKIIVLLSLLCLTICPVLCDEITDDCYDIAKNYYETGDYSSALEYANQILQNNPGYIKAADIKIKLTPPNCNLGETNLTKSVIIKPTTEITNHKKSDNYNCKGLEYFQNKNYNCAKTEFQKAVRFNWFNYYAYNNLGLTYKRLGNNKRAVFNFKSAKFVKKDFTIASDNLAQLYIEEKNYDDAIKVLQKSISTNQTDFVSYYLLGLSQKYLCNYKEAIQNFNKAISLDPKCPLSYLQLADIYHLTNDYSWSNSTLDKYIGLCPDDDYAYFMKSRNYIATEEYDSAKEYIIKAILRNNCNEYRRTLGKINLLLNLPTDALSDFQSINKKNSETYKLMGQCYEKLGKKDLAIECYINAKSFNATK